MTWLDEQGRACPNGQGKPDFRVVTAQRIAQCVREKRCWICGETLGAYKSFVIGPMCAVNRISAEPPQHLECADFAARACPFLVNPTQHRREKGLPEGHRDAAGVMIRRNPGVALIYTTRSFNVFRADDRGVLFELGDPHSVRWYCEGRTATRAEVMASIDGGLPILLAEAEAEGPYAVACLNEMMARAITLVPPRNASDACA